MCKRIGTEEMHETTASAPPNTLQETNLTATSEAELRRGLITNVKVSIGEQTEKDIPQMAKFITNINSAGSIHIGDVDPDYPNTCLLYTSPSPRDRTRSRMPSSA